MADPHNLLMCVTRYGTEKNYVLGKLEECLRACVRPVPGVDIIWAGDRPDDDIVIPSGRSYTDDIVTPARERTRQLALEGGYEKMLWQGVDALYRNRGDFERLISHDVPIVSALISARTITDFACARRWVNGTPCQDDVPASELMSGEMIPAGWPSADNIVIRKECFGITCLGETYVPWYKRDFFDPTGPGNSRDPNAARGKNASSERFCYAAFLRGHQAWIDTSVLVWHVHESGGRHDGPLARLWPDLELPLEEISWRSSG